MGTDVDGKILNFKRDGWVFIFYSYIDTIFIKEKSIWCSFWIITFDYSFLVIYKNIKSQNIQEFC